MEVKTGRGHNSPEIKQTYTYNVARCMYRYICRLARFHFRISYQDRTPITCSMWCLSAFCTPIRRVVNVDDVVTHCGGEEQLMGELQDERSSALMGYLSHTGNCSQQIDVSSCLCCVLYDIVIFFSVCLVFFSSAFFLFSMKRKTVLYAIVVFGCCG